VGCGSGRDEEREEKEEVTPHLRVCLRLLFLAPSIKSSSSYLSYWYRPLLESQTGSDLGSESRRKSTEVRKPTRLDSLSKLVETRKIFVLLASSFIFSKLS